MSADAESETQGVKMRIVRCVPSKMKRLAGSLVPAESVGTVTEAQSWRQRVPDYILISYNCQKDKICDDVLTIFSRRLQCNQYLLFITDCFVVLK